jgi:prepilin-type processing-associated H-X9-DG protein
VQDYDEAYPAGSGTWLNAGVLVSNYQGWCGQIYPYVKSLGVYQCPDETSVSPTNWQLQVSYAMNFLIMQGVGNTIQGLQASQLTSAGNTVAIFEAKGGLANECAVGGPLNCDNTSPTGDAWAGGNLNNNGDYNNGSSTSAIVYATGQMGTPFSSNAFYVAPYHSGGSNFLAADGHVKWLRGEKVSNGSRPSSTTFQAQPPGNYTACGATAMSSTGGAQYTMTFSPL